ncbi:MAG: nicotinamide riboside transporter PnuC [Nibricoccus sp.]
MSEILRTIWAGFAEATWLDQANLALGIIGVVLMIRRTLWAFPVGLLAVSVQGVLFWRASFPADAVLQIFFFVTLAWGWWHWVRDRGAAPELPVTRLSGRGILVTLVAASAAMVGWVLWVAPHVGAQMPWRDAFIAAFSVAAQVLQARKTIENWPLWLVVNAVAVVSYWKAELAYTAFLYAVYFFLAVSGWRSWRVAMRTQAGPEGVEREGAV